MKYDNGERYLKEIDHVSVLEPIDEVFDGATSLMTPNSVMYGSTVTAIIAGFPIAGDLDIAVSNQEYMQLCQNFASSVKWIQVDGKTIPERNPSNTRGLACTTTISSSAVAKFGSPYKGKGAKHLPINKVVAFQTVNDACVQILESKTMTGDRLEDALEVVRKVDFTFCGMAIDMYGRMLEVIPNAYDDCKQRIIRIKHYQHRLDPTRLKQRIHKYTARGWSLTMSIDQALSNLEKAKQEHFKKVAAKSKAKPKKKPISGFRMRKSHRGRIIIEAKKEFLYMIGTGSVVTNNIRHIAMENFSIDLGAATNNSGGIDYYAKLDTTPLTPESANKIIEITNSKIRSKFIIDDESLRAGKKQREISKLYNSTPSNYEYSGGYVSSSTTTGKY